MVALAARVGGNWSMRFDGDEGPDGTDVFEITVPEAGQYALTFSAPAEGIGIGELPGLGLTAVD